MYYNIIEVIYMGRPAEAKMRVEREYGKPIAEVLQELYVVQNMHSSDIAKILDVTSSTIVAWCHNCNIPVKPKGGRIEVPISSHSEIIRLYESGKPSSEIAKLFNCTGGHISWILNKNNIKARGHRERFERKYSFDERYFQNIDTPMKAYFLGWAMSDGCVHFNRAEGCKYTLKIKADDIEVLEEFKNELKYDMPIATDNSKRKYPAKLVGVYSATFVEDLISHGVIPHKSTIMTLPIGIPESLECHFVRGYFDGDGCVTLAHKDTNQYKVEFCGNITMMEWIAQSIEKHTGLRKNKICARNSYFATLSFSCSKVPIIRDFMYPTGGEFGLKRKKDRLYKA
jgi:hypothetical protein